MTKELKALDIIGNYKIKYDVNIKYDNGDETQKRFETIRDMFPKQFALIEKALKRNAKLEKAFDTLSKDNEKVMKELSKEIEKNRALEIIKEKVMSLVSLDNEEICEGHYRIYDGELYSYTELTKEEFDLLKEVLL